MPFTPTFQNVFPTVGASADVWGGILNNRGGESYVDFQAIATVLNATETKADGALQRSGGIVTGEVVLPVSATGVAAAGYKGAPVVSLGATRTLGAVDNGVLLVRSSGDSTVTIAPALAPGSVFPIKNMGAGSITIVRGAGVELRVDGSSVNKNCLVGPYGKGVITVNATNNCSISGMAVS